MCLYFAKHLHSCGAILTLWQYRVQTLNYGQRRKNNTTVIDLTDIKIIIIGVNIRVIKKKKGAK